MRFGVLGPVEVRTDDGEQVAVPGAKVRALLAALLVAEGEPVSADRLLEDLWGPGAPTGAAPLQTAVSRLRRALDAAEPGARERVESGPSGYRLRVARGELDVHRFADLLERARGAPAPADAAAALDEALGLWRGPALADHADAPFAAASVARWEERRAAAREELAEARLALGEHAALVGDLDPLLRAHPLRERLRAAHMRALYLSGRQAEALESYRDFRALLAEEIGVDPGPELERLHAEILDRSVEGAADGGPPSRKGNVPAPIIEPVGRDEDTARITALLDTVRLTTLTGPGGVGKTTLALQVADRSRDRFPDGVWLVELPERDRVGAEGERLAEHVAAALELRDERTEPGMRPAADRLATALRDRRVLLVLDNCEQVSAAAGRLVERLLGAAPELRVLATSREPLGVPGESLYRVPVLAPDDAVRLFAERASAAAPGFVLDWRNVDAVAAICRRLDGLPKAVKLAATRIRGMGVAELAERLDDRFRVLTDPASREHRRTLREVVDWSWDLLDGRERTVLRRISVQVGPFPAAAAEAVAAPGAYGEREGEGDERVWEVLARLVDRSLVEVEHRPDGTARYRLLETIGAYGRERLAEAGEDGSARALHIAHWTAAAEDAAARLHGPGQRRALEDLDAGGPNLGAAVERAVEDGDAGSALRLAVALGWYRYLRGRNGEAVHDLTLALGADGPAPEGLRARALGWRAVLGRMCGCGEESAADARAALSVLEAEDLRADLAEVRTLLALVPSFSDGADGVPGAGELAQAALDGYTGLGDTWGKAFALYARGWDLLRRGELDAARRDAEECHRLFLRTGDPWGESRGAGLLGVLATIAGDYAQARRRQERAQRSAEEAGLWAAAAEELVRLGRLALATRDLAGADRYNRQALSRLGADRCTGPATLAMGGLGMAARRRGDLEEAEAHLRPVLEVHEEEGYQAGRASVLAELGFAAEMRGDAAEARRLHMEGLEASRATGDPRAVAQALEGLAGTDVLEGAAENAARLLGTAQAAREAAGAPQPAPERFDVDRITAAARAALGEERFTALHAEGRGRSLEEASLVPR
ncbi:BTAD domain-containing putative transcriptional regulator [Nocardiopsis sp. RSe5-2]|uniref:BTAD domain-containing putative transcriptional regulator n=1 Tax=Nocardiopsis endophytica TaxID=3018445 RepID=A0ABT4UE28_9ACTN|nr:BTAD domain-containing putative transcriptional regulator [Nocardiopsis endophytica]MDA2815160.1 BTAD domain-containing putative transcriptional regulator [Nocardiopsis endophytica]